MSTTRRLRAVGYWSSDPRLRLPRNDPFPDPRRLVRAGWCAAERPLILAYLRSGWTFAQWRGVSHCRFACDEADMGSRCLTDGLWVWPEGLPHYVERHHVRLPAEFVRTMRRRGWRLPERRRPPSRETQGEPDEAFWMTWGARKMARGEAEG